MENRRPRTRTRRTGRFGTGCQDDGLGQARLLLAKLNGATRLIVAVAAFTGLRLSEIRGLQWADYNGAELFVRRAVWRRTVDQTKTPESKGKVPVKSS